MKKAVSILLSIFMVMTMMPGMVWAEGEGAEDEQGNTQTVMYTTKPLEATHFQNPGNVTWLQDSLTLSGEVNSLFCLYLVTKDSNGSITKIESLNYDSVKLSIRHAGEMEPGAEGPSWVECDLAENVKIESISDVGNGVKVTGNISDLSHFYNGHWLWIEGEDGICLGTFGINIDNGGQGGITLKGDCNIYTKDDQGEYVPVGNLKTDSHLNYNTQLFFLGEDGTEAEKGVFYVIKQKSDEEETALDMSIHSVVFENGRLCKQGPLAGIQIDTVDSTDGQDCFIWKVTVNDPDNFDKVRAAIYFNQSTEPAMALWILGGKYEKATNLRGASNIFAFTDKKGENQISRDFTVNISENMDSKNNTFYVMYPKDTNLQAHVTKRWAYIESGSALGSSNTVEFEEALTDKITIEPQNQTKTIDGQEYSCAAVNLKEYLGHEDIRVRFEAVKGDPSEGEPMGVLELELSMGMNVRIEGKTKGLSVIKNGADTCNEALGLEGPSGAFEKTNNGNGNWSFFHELACATISGEGQGFIADFDFKLEDGYVVDGVTDENGNLYDFYINNRCLYTVTDKNGTVLNYPDAAMEHDWEGAFSSGNREAFFTTHRIAAQMDGKMIQDDKVYETMSKFSKYLKENEFTAEKIADYMEYSIDFGSGTQTAAGREIVIHVSQPKVGKSISSANDNLTVTAEKNNDAALIETGNQNLETLGWKDAEIEQIYDMKTTSESIEGMANITIPLSEIEGNPEDYVVMYISEEGVPMRVETTYIEGKGIAFSTGHFSHYALVKVGDSTPSTPGGSTGGYPPVTPPVTDSLSDARKEASSKVNSYLDTAEFDEEEAEEIKAILQQAEQDIQAAKSEEEIEAIVEAAKAELDKLETAEEKALIKTVKKTKFKATSRQTTLNGKRAIRITWTVPDGLNFDGFEVYRSTSRYKGYGTKPIFNTKNRSYTNNKLLKKGTRYYYKVRGYGYVNDEKVYSDWSYKAWRTVK